MKHWLSGDEMADQSPVFSIFDMEHAQKKVLNTTLGNCTSTVTCSV